MRTALLFAPIPLFIAFATISLTYALSWPAAGGSYTLSDAGCRQGRAGQFVLPTGIFLYVSSFLLSTLLADHGKPLFLGLSAISAVSAILSVIFRNCEFQKTHDVLGGVAVLFSTLYILLHCLFAFDLPKAFIAYVFVVSGVATGFFYLLDSSAEGLWFSVGENVLIFSHALFLGAVLVSSGLHTRTLNLVRIFLGY